MPGYNTEHGRVRLCKCGVGLAGIWLCAMAVTASVLIAVFSHDNGPPVNSSSAGVLSPGSDASPRPRQRGVPLSSNAFERVLQRHKQAALDNRPPTVDARPRHSGGFGSMIRKTVEQRFSGRRSTASGGVNASVTLAGHSP